MKNVLLLFMFWSEMVLFSNFTNAQVFDNGGLQINSGNEIQDVAAGEAYALAVDSYGNSYGSITNSATAKYYLPQQMIESSPGKTKWFKMDIDGNLVWQYAAGFYSSNIHSIFIDPQDNIYVTGWNGHDIITPDNCDDYMSSGQYFLARMKPDGTFAWKRPLTGRAHLFGTTSGHVGFVLTTSSDGYLISLDTQSYGSELIYGEVSSTGDLVSHTSLPNEIQLQSANLYGCGFKNSKLYFYGYYNSSFTWNGVTHIPGNLCEQGGMTHSLARNNFLATIDWNTKEMIDFRQTENMWIKGIQFDDLNNIYIGGSSFNSNVSCVDSARFLGASFPIFRRDGYIIKADENFNLLSTYDIGGVNTPGSAHFDMGQICFVQNNLYVAVQNPEGFGASSITATSPNITSSNYCHLISLDMDLNYRYHTSFLRHSYNPIMYQFATNGNQLSVLCGTRHPRDPNAFSLNCFLSKFLIDARKLTGTAYYDYNNNGSFDASDMSVSGIPVHIEPLPYQVVTNEQGYFEAYIAQGNYTVSIPLPSDNFSHPSPLQAIIVGPNAQNVTINPRAIPAPAVSDIEVEYFAEGLLVVGEQVSLKLIVRNLGTRTEDVEVTVVPYNLDFDASAILFPSDFSYQNGVYTMGLQNFSPGAVRTYEIVYTVPVSMLDDLGAFAYSTVTANISNTDVDSTNNYRLIGNYLVAAYDPNIKEVQEPYLLDIDSAANYKTFHYTIHFQNEGNYFARNIRVDDEIEEKLLINSLKVIQSSHPVRTQIVGNLIQFYFDDIRLVAKSESEMGSRGYVHFSLDRIESVMVEDTFTNHAAIYFDYNPPIITNEALNIFVVIVYDEDDNDLSLDKQSVNSLSVYPNPFMQQVTVVINNDDLKEIECVDINGLILFEGTATGSELQINMEKFASGVYFIRFKGNDSVKPIKVVKV